MVGLPQSSSNLRAVQKKENAAGREKDQARRRFWNRVIHEVPVKKHFRGASFRRTGEKDGRWKSRSKPVTSGERRLDSPPVLDSGKRPRNDRRFGIAFLVLRCDRKGILPVEARRNNRCYWHVSIAIHQRRHRASGDRDRPEQLAAPGPGAFEPNPNLMGGLQAIPTGVINSKLRDLKICRSKNPAKSSLSVRKFPWINERGRESGCLRV
jgi:hypothetical protein